MCTCISVKIAIFFLPIGCLSGWYYGDRYCYKLIKEEHAMTWNDARMKCSELKANMASISSQSEMLLVHQLLIEEDAKDDIFIGVHSQIFTK